MLEYHSQGADVEPRREATSWLGFASLLIGLGLSLLALTCILTVAESLPLQFWFFVTGFLIGILLAIAGIVRGGPRRQIAYLGLVVNVMAMIGKGYALYFSMREAVNMGWMPKPWWMG
jgi:uncharacterized membrane protein